MHTDTEEREERSLGYILAGYYLTIAVITAFAFMGWAAAVSRLRYTMTWGVTETLCALCLFGGMTLIGYTITGGVPFWATIIVFYVLGCILSAAEGASADHL